MYSCLVCGRDTEFIAPQIAICLDCSVNVVERVDEPPDIGEDDWADILKDKKSELTDQF